MQSQIQSKIIDYRIFEKKFFVSDFLKDLNDVQLEAVTQYEGPSMVIAGAGSGKTRVLTYRIAYLLQQGINASSILALTFTNKAANEMKERIAMLVGQSKAYHIWMGTFHSIFARILRLEYESIGYPAKYTIYDPSDSKSLLSSIIKEMQLDTQIYKPGELLGRISWAKNNLISWQSYQSNSQFIAKDQATRKPKIGEIYATYCNRCKRAGAMDFDDLLLNTNILFRDQPSVLQKYQKLFSYLLVDEYQDTNYSQYLIINKLAAFHQNLCVVGDDAQSIYSFRGARIENILNYKKDYPTHKLFKLEQNYRSTQTIVNAANSIIDKNKHQIPKKVWSANERGEKIKIVESSTDNEEAFYITNSIIDTRLANQSEFSEFSILYRTNAQSRVFEDSFRKRNIPYKIYGNLSFYQRKEIKDVLAYFKLLVNPHDDEALKRVINYPARGIGDTTMSKFEECSNRLNISLWTIISRPGDFQLDINKGIGTRIQVFVNLINTFSNLLYSINAYDLAMQITQTTGIITELKNENTIESLGRIENIEELLNSIRDSTEQEDSSLYTLDRYLENISLLTDQNDEKEEDRNKVNLMTIHSSKGLEFNYVFLVGMEETLFPNQMSMSTLQEIEEERRLFYVAVTRARKQVTLSYALNRYRWGTPIDCTPSRFISEIDPQFLQYPDDVVMGQSTDRLKGHVKIKPTESNDRHLPPKTIMNSTVFRRPIVSDPNFIPDDPRLLQEGQTVEHQSFGRGIITLLEGGLPDTKAVVKFENAGEKKLLLKFARLKIVNQM